MENLTVNIKDILKIQEFRKKVNSHPLEKINWVDENGDLIKIDENIISDFIYTGLNNVDFITTEFYKEGFK